MKRFLLMSLVLSLFVLFITGCTVSPADSASNQEIDKNALNTSYNPYMASTIITWSVPNCGENKPPQSFVCQTFSGLDLKCYNAGTVLSYKCINWPAGYKIRFYKDLAYPDGPLDNSPMIFPNKNYFTTTIDATGNERVNDTRKVPYSGHFSISSFQVLK